MHINSYKNLISFPLQKFVAMAMMVVFIAGCVTVVPPPETTQVAVAVKTPAIKTMTNFTPALRCMDDLLLAYGKKDILITTAGIPDSTGKVASGTKDMLHTAASKMSIKSKALKFIDYDTSSNDLQAVFADALSTGATFSLPTYYIRGAITQLDDSALDSQIGGGIALPFLDFGLSRDQVSSVVGLDMNIGETKTRTIIPGVNASNSLIVTRSGKSGESGGKIGKAGLTFNLSLSRSEGLSSGVRSLIELGMIETIGKLTETPYWKCLEIEKTNPTMLEQAREWYDGMAPVDRIKLVQRKLSGGELYKGAIDGKISPAFTAAVGKYQAENGLIADGRVNFDLYYALLDDDLTLAPDPTATAAVATAVQTRAKLTALTLVGDKPGTDYKVHDLLKARVQANADGFMHCYYKDTAANLVRIFPNRFSPNPLVKANITLSLPSENSPFKIRLDKAGREQVACFASERELILPTDLKGTPDLAPLKYKTIEELSTALRKNNATLVEAKFDITVR